MNGTGILGCVCLGLLIISCKPEVKEVADPQLIIDADLAFSEMSVADGISKAFLHYADSSAVIFRSRISLAEVA